MFNQFLDWAEFSATMWRDEFLPSVFLRWFSVVSPGERMSHRFVVIGHERSELRFEVGHRDEVSSPHHLAVNDAEDDFNLIEPRTVSGQIDEPNSVRDVRQELLAGGHGFQDAANFFFPDRRRGRIGRPPIARDFPTCAY